MIMDTLKMKIPKKNINNDQSGFASIAIAMIMIVVLGLMTVGFAKLARHEQQSALDKQLSTQAYYAAESGINDAIYDLDKGYITATGGFHSTAADDTKCMTPLPPARTTNNNINTASGVSYSCLLINVKPTTAIWSDVGPNTDRTLSFDAGTIANLTVSWVSDDNVPAKAARDISSGLSPSGKWSSPAVLRFTIVPIIGGQVSRDQQSFTSFLYPSSEPNNSVVYTAAEAGQGPIVSGACDEGTCKSTITGLDGLGATSFLVHVVDYYTKSTITIRPTDSSGKVLEIANGQAMIDVTGKARNVLKRLQVRVPINQIAGGNTPNAQSRANYAIETRNICKQIKTNQSTTSFGAEAFCQLSTKD
jgi:Tfp pilus assembly protein PilX